MRIPRRWTGSYEFACRTASCRPPGSGGTGGSVAGGITATTFARRALERGEAQLGLSGHISNAWMNADGSIMPVGHHDEDGGYTQATLEGRVRVIASPNWGELTVDTSLMNHGMTVQQVTATRIIYAQTRATKLWVGGPRSIWETKKFEINARDVEGALKKLNDAFEDE